MTISDCITAYINQADTYQKYVGTRTNNQEAMVR
jgi:hypothetical protein